MGDSRIIISLCGQLKTNQEDESITKVVMLAADSSLNELTNRITTLYSFNTPPSSITTTPLPSNICIYDVTYHPPANITSTIHTYSADTGAQSKTLHSMGWFPSGKLLLVLQDDKEGIKEIEEGRGVHLEDEYQYNLPEHLLKKTKINEENDAKKVQLQKEWGGTGDTSSKEELKPSDVFAAVQNRFESDETVPPPSTTNIQNKSQKKKRRTEAERCAKIDARLALLSSSSSSRKKNKKVSHQVRKMLIKSRAEGDAKKKLKEEDKFYLETFIIFDDGVVDKDKEEEEEEGSSYRYFSRMNTAGKVASSIIQKNKAWEKNKEDCTMELLVKQPKKDGGFVYRRLPNNIMLYEAEKDGYLKLFDVVIVRVYRIKGEENVGGGPSQSVLEDDVEDDNDGNDEENDETDQGNLKVDKAESDTKDKEGKEACAPGEANENSGNSDQNEQAEQITNRVDAAIQQMNDADPKNKKKKKSTTTDKVRQMLIKGRAKGDKKAIKEEDDRFYMELIVVVDDGVQTASASSHYVFLSKKKSSVTQILEVAAKQSSSTDEMESEVLIKTDKNDEKSVYFKLPDTLILSEAEEKGYISRFDRMVVRQYPKGRSSSLMLS